MTPLELYEPIFQYVCRLNRRVRAGSPPDADEVRSDALSLLTKCRNAAQTDAALSAQHAKLEMVMMFFVDFTARNSNLGSYRNWRDLAADQGELAGDEKFFDLLDETLADRSTAATERLAVFYTCMGLGFTGWYAGQPEQLRKKMLACASRLRDQLSGDEAKICPDAYSNVNTANLIEPPGASLLAIGIALIGLVLVLMAANFYLYHESSKSLTQSLDRVIQNNTVDAMAAQPAAAASPAAAAQ